MRVLILEDEQLTAKHLLRQLDNIDTSIKTEAVLPSVSAAVDWLSGNPAPDLAFMDIHLEDELVFELFRKTEIRFPVVFTTAYDQYVLDALKVSGIDYLLKPVDPVELARSVQKYRLLKDHFHSPDYKLLDDSLQGKQEHSYRQRFMVNAGTKLFSVNVAEISYFILVSKATYMILKSGKKHIISYSLDDLASQLDPGSFFRINRQCMIAHEAIVTATQPKAGTINIQLGPGQDTEQTVSGDRITAFKEWLGK